MKKLIINILSIIPVEKAIYLIERIRLHRLQKRISYCGLDVALRSGFQVETPQAVKLADNVSFGRDVLIMGAGNTTIGKGTMIANGTKILTTTHDSRASVMRKTGFHKPVTIGEEVWIGADAIILPGVTIGNNAIVGAGAVVTNDVRENEVVVGSPARVIRVRGTREVA